MQFLSFQSQVCSRQSCVKGFLKYGLKEEVVQEEHIVTSGCACRDGINRSLHELTEKTQGRECWRLVLQPEDGT